MTTEELDREAHVLIEGIADLAPGIRYKGLDQLHSVMAAYSRAGRPAPLPLRHLLEELTTEAMESHVEPRSVLRG